METTLFEGQSSETITKRLDALRAEATSAAEAVKTAESAAEQAIAEGAASEKALKALTDAKGRASALAGVVRKAETALAEAEAGEARAARLRDLERFGVTAAQRFEKLDAAVARFQTSADAMLDAAAQIDTVLGSIPEGAPAGMGSITPACVNSSRLIAAFGQVGSYGTAGAALAQAMREFASGLTGYRDRFTSAIASAKAGGG